jgi:UDPglucose 6-dehydrogenase
VKPGATLGVLGLAYKPDTDVVEASQGAMLARALVGAGFRVVVYDPKAMAPARGVLANTVEYAASAADCVRQVDAFAVTTAWPEFRDLKPDDFTRGAHCVAVDCWRVLDAERLAPVCRVIAPGRGDDHVARKPASRKRAAA